MMRNSKNTRINFFTLSPLLVAAIMALASCSSKNTEAIEIAVETSDDSAYTLSETQFKSSGMQFGKMEMKAFHEVVRANGMFDVPPENRASVSTYFGGTVINIALLTGEQVKKGQTLFILENPEFVEIQQDYLEAAGQLKYLKSDYERQKNLAEENVTSQKNFLKAESDYTVTKVKVESLSKKLSLMNINPKTLTINNMHTTIKITSPINGYVTKVNITRGAFLSPSQTAIALVNMDHLHLELNIFEKDLSKVSVGQAIHFKIQDDASQEYEAAVHLVNKTVDEDHRTIGIHGHITDESLTDRFTPGMYVEAVIYTTSNSKASLPQNAVVEMDDKFYVLVLESSENSEYAFVKMEVQTGAASNGTIEILNAEAFKSNAEFLVNGAFNLITE